jgi:hypothetical protein
MEISKEEVKTALSVKEWDFGNRILYNLCRDNFEHKEKDKIIAKVWLIGRSYAAAIERRKNKTDINDNFYIDIVAPAFQKSELEVYLKTIKKYNELNIENIEQILKTHYYLMSIVKEITDLEKRSFCSKYLHFHLPNLFFLFDSRAQSALREFISHVPNEFTKHLKSSNIDIEYSKFFIKSYYVKKQIEDKFDLNISIREFDKILISRANKTIKA